MDVLKWKVPEKKKKKLEETVNWYKSPVHRLRRTTSNSYKKLYFRKLKRFSFDDFGVLIEKFISSLSWLVQLPSIESPIFMWKR